MKKSKHIQLILISAVLASCNSKKENDWGDGEKKVYMRSDTTARYSPAGHAWLWFFAFRSFGQLNNGRYQHSGYYNNTLHPNSNFGSNAGKRAASRGGFGRSARAGS